MKKTQKIAPMYLTVPITRVDKDTREVEGYAFVNEVVPGEGGMRLKRSAMQAATSDYMKLSTEGLMRGSNKEQAEYLAILRQNLIINADQWLELMDMEPQEGDTGKAYLNPNISAAGSDAFNKDRVEAVASLYRAGFDPEAVLAALGLPPIKHTGAIPITVKTPDLVSAEIIDKAGAAPATDGNGTAQPAA